jgi:hypothetical protein
MNSHAGDRETTTAKEQESRGGETVSAVSRYSSLVALQRTVGNAAVCRLLARQGYAPREPPVLARPLGEELAQQPVWELRAERRRLEKEIEALEPEVARAETRRRAEAIDVLLQSDSYLESRQRAFEADLHDALPAIEDSLQRDDDRVRVEVERVWVARERGWKTSHVVYADLKISKKVVFSGYGAPQAAGTPIVMTPEKKRVVVLEANFQTNEVTYPEPGLISEGLGPLEYLSLPKTVGSLGRLGLKWIAKRGARAGKGARGFWQWARTRFRRSTSAGGVRAERLRLMHGTGQKGLEGIGAVGLGHIDVKHALGESRDLGRGFYLSTDKAIAESYAQLRSKGGMQHVLQFEVPVNDLGKVVDIRRGGQFHEQWQRFLDEDAYSAVFGIPVPLRTTTVRSFLTVGRGIEQRSRAFERFLEKIGMDDADTILASSGNDLFKTAAGHGPTQVCIRSQKVANRLNSIIRGSD